MSSAREAFYAGKLTASTAILIARIPIAALQIKATQAITEHWQGVMPTRLAQSHIEQNYMLKLKDAPFKTGDATLCPAAGACATCPKRTGNAPELFADVAGADVCTDPECFATKRDAHVVRIRVAAEAKGQVVISGTAATKIKPSNYGQLQGGYVDLDDTFWTDGKQQTYRKVLGKSAPVATLLEDPHKVGMIEIVKRDDLVALLAEKGIAISKGGQGIDVAAKAREKAQEAHAAIERQYRRKLFLAVRDDRPESLDPWDERIVATMLMQQCPNTEVDFITSLYGLLPADYAERMEDGKWTSQRQKLNQWLEALPIDRVRSLIRDLTMIDELAVHTYTGRKDDVPLILTAAAQRLGVPAAQIRAAVEAEAQAKLDAKAAKKKPAKAAA